MSGLDHQQRTPYAVFVGLDVGKGEHHACALDVDGARLHDRALPNEEAALRQVLARLAACGRVLLVVDQPGFHRGVGDRGSS